MRINVVKFLFMGALKSKESFFAAAQRLGMIEFINPEGKRKVYYPPEIETIVYAIKILRGYVQEEQELKKDLKFASEIAKIVTELRLSCIAAEEELRAVEQEILRIKNFGYFSIEELKRIEEETEKKVRFFCAKSSKQLEETESALVLINRKEGVDYFLAIQNEPLVYPDLIELHFTESLTSLETRQENLREKIQRENDELKALTRYDSLLHQALLHGINKASLSSAEHCSAHELENQLFVVEGWVPEKQIEKIQACAKSLDVYAEEVALDVHEVAPTHLENQGMSRVGEDLVRIFDTPSNKDKDPSLWVLIAFSLFFSMIVYDAGYGLVFLSTALFLQFKLQKKTPSAKRFLGLLATLAICTTLWGSLTHSYFGIQFSQDSFFRKHSLMTWIIEKKASFHLQNKDAVYQDILKKCPQLGKEPTVEQFLYVPNPTDLHETPVAKKFTDNVLMELVLFLGAIHICLGLARYVRTNPVGIGWIAFIIGAYLYIPSYLAATSLTQYVFNIPSSVGAEFGFQLLIFGLILTPIIGMIQHGISGVFEFVHSIQVFADVLSYLRIYALATAGFIISETVNQLAAKTPLLIISIALFFVGHLLNILLAIMGGTIHGLRLNFLEWYRYSFYGNGKEFRPLNLQTLE